MKIEEVKKSEARGKSISIRTFPSYMEWLSKKDVSPSKVFNQAVEELQTDNSKSK